jgi:transketolase
MLRRAARTGRIFVYEDHHRGTGLGVAVAAACAEQGWRCVVRRLGIARYGGSGRPDELYAEQGLAPQCCAATITKKLKQEHIKTPILEVQCSNVIEALSLFEKQPWVVETSVFGIHVHVTVSEESTARREIVRLLSERDIRLDHVERITPSLEDVFIYLLDQEAKRAA